MDTTSAIWNHAATQAGSAGLASLDSSGSDTGSSSSGNSATISANDFLTLLVTEMQNQDPTANTDPNEYINQLVNVNSLEQLISINQTLSSDAGSATASTGTSGANSGIAGERSATGGISSRSAGAIGPAATPSATAHFAPGNLSVPSANPSAQRVAQSLNGH